MSSPSGVTYIKRLKEMTAERIKRRYNDLRVDESLAANTIKGRINKEFMENIEQYVLDTFTVKKIPKCESKHSSYTTERIELGFYPDLPDDDEDMIKIAQHMKKSADLQEEMNVKLAALDDWEFQAVNAAARKQELPEFEE